VRACAPEDLTPFEKKVFSKLSLTQSLEPAEAARAPEILAKVGAYYAIQRESCDKELERRFQALQLSEAIANSQLESGMIDREVYEADMRGRYKEYLAFAEACAGKWTGQAEAGRLARQQWTVARLASLRNNPSQPGAALDDANPAPRLEPAVTAKPSYLKAPQTFAGGKQDEPIRGWLTTVAHWLTMAKVPNVQSNCPDCPLRAETRSVSARRVCAASGSI